MKTLEEFKRQKLNLIQEGAVPIGYSPDCDKYKKSEVPPLLEATFLRMGAILIGDSNGKQKSRSDS